jgi:hypothetical protein
LNTFSKISNSLAITGGGSFILCKEPANYNIRVLNAECATYLGSGLSQNYEMQQHAHNTFTKKIWYILTK